MIGGDVKQGGNGDCQQNVIGGNNNSCFGDMERPILIGEASNY